MIKYKYKLTTDIQYDGYLVRLTIKYEDEWTRHGRVARWRKVLGRKADSGIFPRLLLKLLSKKFLAPAERLRELS